jgi:hypothetical protein
LAEERDQGIARRRRNCGIQRSSCFYSLVERVRLIPAVNGIQGIVDGKVHHRVQTRFVKWVVERSDACLRGGHTGVCIPGGDGIAAGRRRQCVRKHSNHRPGRLGEYGGHKGHNEKYPSLYAHHAPHLFTL